MECKQNKTIYITKRHFCVLSSFHGIFFPFLWSWRHSFQICAGREKGDCFYNYILRDRRPSRRDARNVWKLAQKYIFFCFPKDFQILNISYVVFKSSFQLSLPWLTTGEGTNFFYTFMFFIYLKNIFHAFSYLYNSVLYFLSYLSLAD